MKLKFINCLIAVALLGGSAQILTSCKDTNEDEFAQLTDQYLTLKQKHDQDIATLNGLISSLQGQLTNLQAELDGYVKKADFNNYVDAYIKKVSEYENLKQVLDNLKSVYDEVQGAHGKYATIGERFAALEGELAVAKQQIGDLNDFMNEWKSALGTNTTIQDVVNTVAIANQNAADIAALQAAVAALQGCNCAEKIAEIEGKIAAIQESMATQDDLATLAQTLREEAAANLAAVEAEIAAVTGGSDTTIAQLEEMLSGLDIAITNVSNRVTLLEQAIASVLPNLENRISSIELQGTYNPVFGSFNIPVGIQSNILTAYMGYNGYNHVKFPSTSRANTYNQQDPVVTDTDLRMMAMCGLTPVEIAQGELLMNTVDGQGYLGKIYFTVNPANIDLEGKEFVLENSRSQASVVKLTNIKPSDKLITFGYSRSAENGLYEADAMVATDAASLAAARLTLGIDFENNVLDIVSGKAPKTNTIITLANEIYNGFNGVLPALGVAGSWAEEGNTLKVTSQYGVAAAVFQPLSFRFLNSTKLPTIPAIPNLGNFEFNIGTNTTDLTFDTHYSLVGGGLNIQRDLHIILAVSAEKIDVSIENYPVLDGNGEDLGSTTLEFSGATITELPDEFEAQLLAQIPADANASLRADMEAAVAKLMANVRANIDENSNSINIVQDFSQTLLDIQDDINGKIESVTDKLGNILPRVQNVLNRVNRFLSNPTHYLQPVLLYRNGDEYGMLSNCRPVPTSFVVTAGNAVTLVPTTYTAEVVAPAYKKVVAVTNVYLTADTRHRASGMDETWQPDQKCVELLKAANEKPYMCEIISGERRTIPFSFEGGQGYTYEILYTAIDFQGAASSQKFYVSVK